MAFLRINKRYTDISGELSLVAFRSKDMEHDFRQHILPDSKGTIILSIGIMFVFHLPDLYIDIVRAYDTFAPHLAIINQALFLLLSMLLVILVKRIENEKVLDSLIFGYILYLCLTHILFFPDTQVFLPHTTAIHAILIGLLYILFPVPFHLKVIPPLGMTAWFFISWTATSREEFLQLFILYTLINCIGLLFSMMYERGIRMQYSLFRSESDAREMLKLSQEKYSNIVDNVRVGILVLQDSRVVFANRKVEEILGLTSEEIMNKNDAFDYVHPLDREKIREHHDQDMEKGITNSTRFFRVTSRDQGTLWIESLNVLINWNGKTASLEFLTDITERKNLQDELERLAMTDHLTGANNRRAFLEMASNELEKARRYRKDIALMMLDIDHFKKINDTHGHDTGDIVLKEFVITCRSCLRAGDIFGRLGGEEFALLLLEADGESANNAAERIRSLVEDMVVTYKGKTLKITVSIGITTLTGGSLSIDEMIHQADMALYEAKRQGRNQVRMQ